MKLLMRISAVAWLILLSVLVCVSCSQKNEVQKWEYKTIVSSGSSIGKFTSRSFEIPQDELNSLGAEGWELVDVYTQIETVHPNFGNADYVTGLKPNTRTNEVFYVFKRPVIK